MVVVVVVVSSIISEHDVNVEKNLLTFRNVGAVSLLGSELKL